MTTKASFWTGFSQQFVSVTCAVSGYVCSCWATWDAEQHPVWSFGQSCFVSSFSWTLNSLLLLQTPYLSHAFSLPVFKIVVLSPSNILLLSVLLLTVSLLWLVTDFWLGPQLRFCWIPTCDHLLPTFGFFTDYASALTQPVISFTGHRLAHLLVGRSWRPRPGTNMQHLHHQKLWGTPVSA